MEDRGNVRVSPEALATVAGHAATNVAGVARLAVPWMGRLRQLIHRERLDDAVRVQVDDGDVEVQVEVVVRNGVDLLDVATRIRQEVSDAIARVSALNVRSVAVHIQDVE